MNIKKQVLSLAVIAGLTFSCVPQVNASTASKANKVENGFVNGVVNGMLQCATIAMAANAFFNDSTYTLPALGLLCASIYAADFNKKTSRFYQFGYMSGSTITYVVSALLALGYAATHNSIYNK